MKHFHPRANEHGHPVELNSPSQPSPLAHWGDPSQIATVTPDGPMPASLNGLAFMDWAEAPTSNSGWEELAGSADPSFTEPPMVHSPGKAAASGVVVLEDDGRVWVVSPSNGFGGYVNTFPKGKLDPGMSLRGNALKEGFEESGLRVVLTGFLCDSIRSTSVTRYYAARRVGGNPARMSWETQAVHLVPPALLVQFAKHPNDNVVLQALRALQG